MIIYNFIFMKIIYSYNKNLKFKMKYLRLFERLVKEPPFISSARKGSTNAVKQALKDGEDVNMKDSDGKTALMHAVKFPFVVDALIEGKADVNEKDRNGITALMMASTPTVINKLLNAKADVNMQDINGETAIMRYLSCFYDSGTFISILEKFLKSGLNLDIKNNEGENFYDLMMGFKEYNSHKQDYINDIEIYINNKFPKYKKDFDLKTDINKFNV